ncbi:hypothetical protein EDC04DRAFT_2602550 [Pisolithus marmoratus]|nr:hypothetical protein EDC04DRAFT_2602550 [Pisolithus marmoratus]
MRFDVELARVADLDLVPILASSGVEIGYSCDGHQFVHGLLRLPLLVDTLELVEVLHPDDIRFQQQLVLTLPQFWREQDIIEGERGTSGARGGCLSTWIGTNDLLLFCVMMMLLSVTCHRRYSGGYSGSVLQGKGYVVTLHEHTIVLVIMQPDKTSETSHLQEHILSLGPADNALQSAFPLSGDEALPGDVVRVHCGPLLARGESSSGLVLTDRGYNVAVGDTMEVARDSGITPEGIVKTVDLTKASLDIVCPVDGIQINVPIMFVCKIKERFDHGLSQFVGHDVWNCGW